MVFSTKKRIFAPLGLGGPPGIYHDTRGVPRQAKESLLCLVDNKETPGQINSLQKSDQTKPRGQRDV